MAAIRFGRPSDAKLQTILSSQAGASVTYPEVGATAEGQLPDGYAQQPAGKRPLTHADYDGWRSLQGQLLSDDGKYLAYNLLALVRGFLNFQAFHLSILSMARRSVSSRASALRGGG